MSPLQRNQSDHKFVSQVEDCSFPVAEFNHRAHLRLAYCYLAEHDADASITLMRDSLLRLLTHNKVDPTKFHETMTKAWILAVQYFMNKTETSDSADAFIDQNPEMLDSKIMLTHYSAALLFSDEAREAFIRPDLSPIPTLQE